MSINNINPGAGKPELQQTTAKRAEQQPPAKAPAQAETAKLSQDAVSLTPRARDMETMQRRMSKESPFDKDKVESLKKAIAAGEYKVDSEKLAATLLKFEEELFGN
ncbi:flagellar biosynthesis anti-sigma factor FlgM [Gallaecimonas sp. GXIMD4217]|uniref:flagellar biosynthesis anti-sigma factor FlgM n=1 Tax=Gallaecimonas sp. GXIMD4217 TaxID=3131927 RepID=UPI00311AD469